MTQSLAFCLRSTTSRPCEQGSFRLTAMHLAFLHEHLPASHAVGEQHKLAAALRRKASESILNAGTPSASPHMPNLAGKIPKPPQLLPQLDLWKGFPHLVPMTGLGHDAFPFRFTAASQPGLAPGLPHTAVASLTLQEPHAPTCTGALWGELAGCEAESRERSVGLSSLRLRFKSGPSGAVEPSHAQPAPPMLQDTPQIHNEGTSTSSELLLPTSQPIISINPGSLKRKPKRSSGKLLRILQPFCPNWRRVYQN